MASFENVLSSLDLDVLSYVPPLLMNDLDALFQSTDFQVYLAVLALILYLDGLLWYQS